MDRIRLSGGFALSECCYLVDIFEVQFVHISYFLHGTAPYDPLFKIISQSRHHRARCLVTFHLCRLSIISLLYCTLSVYLVCHSQISIFIGLSH